MLVTTDDPRMPVAIVVCEWKINKETRQFAITPFQVEDKILIKVEVPEKTEVISPALPEWASAKVGFGDDSAGYPTDEQTMQDLYEVWDDGSSAAHEASARLYSAFTEIIDHYKAEANRYLATHVQKKYEQAVSEAKKNGWDTGLIKLEKQTFPYFLQD